jgi:primase-polymerase (primpol)-like protein
MRSAVKHYQGHLGNGVAGVGFEFSPADPYAGIDLDKCRDPQTWEDTLAWAKRFI